MKINIGPYTDWFGPYQFFDLLQHFKVSEDTCSELARKYGYMLLPFFSWIESFKSRKVSIKIDNYDTWSLDDTLSMIIVPCLKQLRDVNHGAPMVDIEDVPAKLKPTKKQMEKYYKDGTTDPKFFKRWEYVMDEMIWAFEQTLDDWTDQFHKDGKFDKKGYEKYNKRIKNGTMFFGKYFDSLWD